RSVEDCLCCFRGMGLPSRPHSRKRKANSLLHLASLRHSHADGYPSTHHDRRSGKPLVRLEENQPYRYLTGKLRRTRASPASRRRGTRSTAKTPNELAVGYRRFEDTSRKVGQN